MTGERRRTIMAGLLVADLVLFGGWIGALQLGRRGDQQKLPVEGYDPRDLLSGHYVRFRLSAEREAAALLPGRGSGLPQQASWSFCTETIAGRLHPVRVRQPGEQCSPILTGALVNGTVSFGVERFYVDERRAPSVASVLAGPETYLVATIDDEGAVHALDLVVGGKSVGARK
jgi:uncharacterized membrane-anchored protein